MEGKIATVVLLMLTVIFVPVSGMDGAGGPELSAEGVMSGGAVIVDLSIDVNPGLYAMQFFVEYDPSVFELADIDRGSALSTLMMTTSQSYAPHCMVMFDGGYPDEGKGTVVSITFDILDEERAGSSPIVLGFGEGSAVVPGESGPMLVDLEDITVNAQQQQSDMTYVAIVVAVVLIMMLVAVVSIRRRNVA